LFEIFKDAKVGDLKHRVIIPTINYSSGKVQLFKTRHHSTFITDYKRSLVDVAMSTAAAPVYFPVYHTTYGDFVDGGLVANHPGFFAILEVKRFLGIEAADISMLHIGTLSQRFTSDGRTNLGLLRWRTKLLNLLFSCQDQSVNQIVQFLLNDRYYTIDEVITEQQSKKIALDKTDYIARKILIQHAEEKAKEFMGTEKFRALKEYTAQEFKPIS
jgi:phospholipase, patatin family